MRHLLLEFITGGGFANQSLPEKLLREGEMMSQTLVDELSLLPGSEITVVRDKRLELDNDDIKQILINQSLEEELDFNSDSYDVVWLIAPETDGILASLNRRFSHPDRLLIGCSLDAVILTSSKLASYEYLQSKGIPTIPTMRLEDNVPDYSNGWVVKPDDGVGAEGCILIRERNELNRFGSKQTNYIVQPFEEGQSISMSLLIYNSEVSLLACNSQDICLEKNQFVFNGVQVNACLHYKDELNSLASKIAQEIPGLAGYVGVDILLKDDTFKVLDINPRFTTSYAGIPQSTKINIAEQVLYCFINKKLPVIDITQAEPVEITL